MKATTTSTLKVTFQLQKKLGNGEWQNADENDLANTVTPLENPKSITVTLDGFTSSKMSDASNAYSVKAVETVDDVTYQVDYRWVEVDVEIDGETSTIVSTSNGEYAYVNRNGKQSGPDDTTAIFKITSEGSSFTNTLEGEHRLIIDKKFYAANNVNISGDEGILGNTTVTFIVYQNGVEYKRVEMNYSNLVKDEQNSSNDCWLWQEDCPRYDEAGNEYRYTVNEIVSNNWNAERNYEVSSVLDTDANNQEVYIKQTKTNYTNGPGGRAIYIDVNKEWQDGSDLTSRQDVTYSIYRIKKFNESGELVSCCETVGKSKVLNESNNWFFHAVITAQDYKDGDGNTKLDSAEYYSIVEDKIADVSVSKAAELSSLLSSVNGSSAAPGIKMGTVGSTSNEGDTWDGLYYIYNAYAWRDSIRDGRAEYTINNVRTGKQNLYFTKTWNAAGTVNGCVFSVTNANAEVCRIKMIANADNTAIASVQVKWACEENYSDVLSKDGIVIALSDDAGATSGETNTATATAINYSKTVTITGLEKYGSNGELVDASIVEIAMLNKAGAEIDMSGGSALVDGIRYTVSYNKVKRGTVDDKTHHNSPDEYDYTVFNTRSKTIDLVTNKVWRDNNTLVRPDISFTLYRVSTKTHPELIGASDLVTGIVNAKNAWEPVIKDYLWNTNKVERNEYWWTCTINNMPQYDDDGYAYIYFGVEKTSPSVYEAYYCNQTGEHPGNPTTSPYTTKDVFGVPTAELTPAADNSVFIIADGVNFDDSSKPSYSATVVNIPVIKRPVTGEKLWKMPNWAVDNSYLPDVTVALYRTSKEMPNPLPEGKTYQTWLLENAEVFSGGNKKVDTQVINNGNGYTYNFQSVDKYDQWGSPYYYYILEDSVANSCYPLDKVEYNGTDMSFTNVFSETPPYAEITVSKTWVVDANQINKWKSALITGLDALDMPSVTFTLFSQATASNGESSSVIGKKLEMGTVVLSPTGKDGETAIPGVTISEDTIDDTHKQVTASYTFKTYTNSATGETENLPYFGPNGQPLQYSVTESKINGYQSQDKSSDTSDHSVEKIKLEKKNDNLYTNESTGSTTGFKNTYDNSRSLSFTKSWDEYADNTAYRPDAIRFKIERRHNTTTTEYTDDFNKASVYVVIPKPESNSVNWTQSGLNHLESVNNEEYYLLTAAGENEALNVLKYSPEGEAYTYKIVEEAFLSKTEVAGNEQFGEYWVIGTAGGVGEVIGNYTLAKAENTKYTNKLNTNINTSIKVTKNWVIDGSNIMFKWQQFSNLRDLGCLPEKVQYIVQRSTNNTDWENVLSTVAPDNRNVITVEGKEVLGYETDLTRVTENNRTSINFSAEWKNLPNSTPGGTASYTYRVVEKLIWKDGSKVLSSTDNRSKGVTATFTAPTGDTKISNAITTAPVKFVKVWQDETGYDYIRPESIDLTIKPVTTKGNGLTFNLVAREGNTSRYESDVFYVSPENLTASYSYDLTEVLKYPDGMPASDQYQAFIVVNDDATTGRTAMTKVSNTKFTASGIPGNKVFNTSNEINILNTTLGETGYPTRKTITLNATKTWQNDSLWKDTVRPDVYYKLMYKEQGKSTWKDFDTDKPITAFSNTETLAIKQLTYDNGNPKQVTWSNMYKYWKPNSKDGVAELIEYRIVEMIKIGDSYAILSASNSSYTPTNKIDGKQATYFTFTDSKDEYTKAYTNTMNRYNFELKKSWPKNGSGTLSTDELSDLIKLKAVPEKIKFAVEYMEDGSWAAVPKTTDSETVDLYVEYNTLTLLNAQTISANLPIYDKKGVKIQYRIREVGIKYSGETGYKDVYWTDDIGSVDSFTTAPILFNAKSSTVTYTAYNTYDYTSLTVYKNWVDEGNRDGLRGDVKFTIYRDGNPYAVLDSATGKIEYTDYTQQSSTVGFVSKTYENNKWSFTWNYLPKYQNGTTTPSVYTWSETAIKDSDKSYTDEQPTVYTYSAAPDGTTKTNSYTPARGSLTAEKIWSDYEDKYGARPDSISLTLEYSTDNGTSWSSDFEAIDVNKGTNVYTSSTVTQTLNSGNSWTATWTGLPVNVNNGTSHRVLYRVRELSVGEYQTAYSSKSVSLQKNSSGEYVASVDVTNTLQTKTVQVKKDWEYSGNGGSISNVSDLVNYGLIPEYIKMTLCASTNSNVIETKEFNVTDLAAGYQVFNSVVPVNDKNGNAITYTIAETEVKFKGETEFSPIGNYSVLFPADSKAATLNGDKFNADLKNVLTVTQVAASKTWVDGNNRDGSRPGSITVNLYADYSNDKILQSKTVIVDPEGNWKTSFINLPKYHKNGSEVVYTITEDSVEGYTGVINGYTAVNTRNPQLIEVKANKNWVGDAENTLNTRQTVTFKLQYSTDNGATWQDFTDANRTDTTALLSGPADTVYITSNDAFEQTIAVGSPTAARWSGLTAYVWLQEAETPTAVQYRVVETTDIKNYTKVNEGISEAVDIGSTSKDVSITNRFIKGNLEVSKKFQTNGAVMENSKIAELINLGVLPGTLKVTVTAGNFTVDGNAYSVTKDMTFNNGYPTVTFENLPVYNVAGDVISYTVSDAATGYAFINCTAATVNALIPSDTVPATITNDYESGSLKVVKNWVDEDDRELGRKKIDITLYRNDGSIVDKTKSLTSENNWSITWDNLPLKNNSNETIYYYVRENEAKEDNGVIKFVGNDGITYIVTYPDNVALDKSNQKEYNITNKYEPQKRSIEAAKKWIDLDKDKSLRPDKIKYTLEYWSVTESKWLTVPNTGTYTKDNVICSGDNPQDVDVEKSEAGTAIGKWDNLPVYINVNNVRTPVRYRVVEESVDNYYEPSYLYPDSSKQELTLDSVADIAKVEVTNPAVGTYSAKKVWNDAWKGTQNYFGTRPDYVYFQLQYKDGDDWKNYGNEVKVPVDKQNSTQDPYTWEELPTATYRAIETGLGYINGNTETRYDVTYSNDVGDAGNYVSTFTTSDGLTTVTNALPETTIAVTKTWEDGHNSDSTRPESITLKLLRDRVQVDEVVVKSDGVYRDGAKIGDVEFIDNTDKADKLDYWKFVWKNLPVYQNGSTSDKSVYTIVEDYDGNSNLVDYYDNPIYSNNDASVTANQTTGMGVLNRHLTYLAVDKVWSSNTTVKPRITVQLQRREAGKNWEAVRNDDGSYRTLELFEGNNWCGKFEDLSPSYEYRAFETQMKYPLGKTIIVHEPDYAEEELIKVVGDLTSGFSTYAETQRIDIPDEFATYHYYSTLTNNYYYVTVPVVNPPTIVAGQRDAVPDKGQIIEDEEVPKAKLPNTGAMGDISLAPFIASNLISLAGSVGSIGFLLKGGKKKEEEDQAE